MQTGSHRTVWGREVQPPAKSRACHHNSARGQVGAGLTLGPLRKSWKRLITVLYAGNRYKLTLEADCI